MNIPSVKGGNSFDRIFIRAILTKTVCTEVLSAKNESTLREVSKLILAEKFRIYFNNDIIGTQVGGAMKNIIAIACGYITGLELEKMLKLLLLREDYQKLLIWE